LYRFRDIIAYFLKGWVTLSANFRQMWTSPAIDLWTVRVRNDVATTLLQEVFTQRNSVADFLNTSWILLAKPAKLRFAPPFYGLRENVHGSSMARG